MKLSTRILNLIHDAPEPITSQEIRATLSGSNKSGIYTTLNRLRDGGYITATRHGRYNRYTPGPKPPAPYHRIDPKPFVKPVGPINLGPISRRPFDPDKVRAAQIDVELALYGERI